MEPITDLTRPGGEGDDGFSLVEQVVAMMILFIVLLGLLVALGAGVRGIADGRHRTVATSLAKQTIEQLQGSSYTSVAMNLSSPGLTTDPAVTVLPNLTFKWAKCGDGTGCSEPLVGGAAAEYKVQTTEAGATFTVATFVTAVTPAADEGSPHRRITVIVDWTPSASGNSHSMRFSSLVYPLDYTSYPAGQATSEATGATVRVAGSLGVENFDDVYLVLPSARAAASTSTLRRAQGSAGSSTGVVDVGTGAVFSPSSPPCAVSGATADIAQCELSTADSNADNDAGTAATDLAQTPAVPFAARSVHTPGGVKVTAPAVTATTRASTDACNSCGFGDADGEPWASGSSSTTTGSAATFSASAGTLTGALWNMGPGWSIAAQEDHDPSGGGLATSTASLRSPAVDILRLDGVAGYTAAVKIGPLDAAVSTISGHTATAPSATRTVPTVAIWDGTAYRTVTPPDVVAATFRIGDSDHQVQLISRVEAQPSTVTSAGTSIKSDAAAQFPSLLVVTVEVVITSVATAAQTAAFSVTFDFGRISAHSTWIQQ